MRNKNFFCKVEGSPEDRDRFFAAYHDVLERQQEFNSYLFYLPDGTATGVSYLAAHPQTDELIYRSDIFWTKDIEIRSSYFGLRFQWDQVKHIPATPIRKWNRLVGISSEPEEILVPCPEKAPDILVCDCHGEAHR